MYSLWATILLLICLLLALYLYGTRNFNYWKRLQVPFAKPLPFFGSLFDVFAYRKTLYTVLTEIYDSSKTAGYVGFFQFNQPSLLIRDPNLAKHVLIKDFEYFADRFAEVNERDKTSSNLIFVAKSRLWRAIRTKITPIFTTNKIKRSLPLVLQVSEDMKEYIKNVAINSEYGGGKKLGMKYMTDVISSCAFGINARSFKDEDAEFCKATAKFFEPSFDRALSMSAYFMAPRLVKLLNLNMVESVSANFMRRTFWKYLKEREESGSARGDLIDLLIELRKAEGGNYLDEEVIVTQPIQFLFAGFDTTGVSLSLSLYSVAKHPHVQDRVRREIKNVLEKHGTFTYEALKDMKYLGCVINETLRLYPVLPFLNRICVKPYPIPGTDLVLEKGTAIYISLLGLHLDPQYFANPEQFDPDRFSDENKANIKTATYMPFGEGPRNCIGIRFAIMALKVALSQILLEYEIRSGNTTTGPLKCGVQTLMITPTSEQLDFRFRRISETE